MGITTKIEWCDSTVNPIMGCTGCALRKDHCYAAKMCEHYAGRKGWPKSFDEPEFFPGRLEKAVRWGDLTGKKRDGKPWLDGLPRHIFVNDMSDGFCPDADPWEWLAPLIPAMHLSPHIWLLLTKWPHRMQSFFEEWGKPIPNNFYLGVSIESQDQMWRLEHLLNMAAARKFISHEPLLSRINYDAFPIGPRDARYGKSALELGLVHQIMVGCESGPNRRPMQLDWARDLRDQCQSAGVPFFLKQAVVDGKLIKMPELGGKRWAEMPVANFATDEESEAIWRFNRVIQAVGPVLSPH